MQAAHTAGGPRLIKKYSNRKLYDTTSRQYITLERIGVLLHSGESVQVIDRTSGEDLTAITLSQVVLERERKRHGAAPELLQQLVRAPGEAVAGAVRQSIAVGQDFLQRAEERVVRAPEAALEAALEETLLRTLRSLKIPSQREMGSFDRRLRELSQRIDALAAAIEHAVPETKAAKKPGAKQTRKPSRGRGSG